MESQVTVGHLTEKDAAKFLGVTLATVRAWRYRKLGPLYCKFNRAIRYPVEALAEYASKSEVQPK